MSRSSTRTSAGSVVLALRLVLSTGRRQLAFIVFATVLTSVSVAGQLLVGRRVLDLLAENRRVDGGDLAPYLAVLGVLLVGGALSQAIANDLRIPLFEDVYRRTMDEILDVATEVDLEAYEAAQFHDRLERASVAAGGRVASVVFGLVTLISTLIIAAGVVAVLLTVTPALVPIALFGYVPIALVNVRNNRERYRLEVDLTELNRERLYFEQVLTDRNDAKEVRSYGMAPTIRRWHAQLWDERIRRLRRLIRRRLGMTLVGATITNAVLVATLGIAFVLVGRGSISLGDAAAAIVGLQQLSSRLQSAGVAFSGVHEGTIFLQDFEEFRATLPVIRDARASGVPPTPPSVLTVDGVGYRYPEAEVDALESVSFEVRTGQVLAIVGANGSGKSTLMKVLCQLLPPSRGRVTWDGVDIAGCDQELVKAQIAPVFQDFARLQLTLRQAIGLGDSRRLDEGAAIRAAADEAGLAEVIDSHAAGIDTRLGKMFTGGTDLSLGQWQRLAIARALFRDAPIIVLDEPSASLDPQAEADLFDLLHRMCADRIVIFVSHRFATVRRADAVMVLHQGDVVELGTHDELMARHGLYAGLFNLQAERYGLND